MRSNFWLYQNFNLAKNIKRNFRSVRNLKQVVDRREPVLTDEKRQQALQDKNWYQKWNLILEQKIIREEFESALI